MGEYWVHPPEQFRSAKTCKNASKSGNNSYYCCSLMEQPIFTTKAHVFHIDPQTKRSWIPASSQAINVSFFYDSPRNLYRIISVEGTKAIINSTVTPNMTFTKTSQKFGQWSDIRANTVYGLGFASEADLNKFIEKFHEVKESTRNAAQHKSQANGTIGSGTPTVNSSSCSPCPSSRSGSNVSGGVHHRLEELINEDGISTNTHIGGLDGLPNNVSLVHHQNDVNCVGKAPLVAHQRSQSLSGLQANKVSHTDSPKHQNKEKLVSSIVLPQSTTEAQLRYENDRLKLALAQSSANAKKWEIELQTLKNNNSRLTNALQESTSNVEEWKKQLQALKDENSKMRLKIIELEAIHGNPEAIAELRKEIGNLRSRAESLDVEVKQKDKEIEGLKQRLEDRMHIYSTNTSVEDKLKVLLNENENLRNQLSRLHDQSDTSKVSDKAKRSMLDQLNVRLAVNVQELRSIQSELTALLNTS